MERVKQILFRCAAAVGAPRALHRFALPRSLTILMYHGVLRQPLDVPDWCFIAEADFRSQMRYLKRHFEVLPLAEAARRLHANSLTRPAAVITFDDGYQNNHDVAFPILRELNLPATIFLATGFVDSDSLLWFCRLNRALAHTERTTLAWNGLNYDISTPEDRAAACAALQSELKQLDHESLLHESETIVAQLGSSAAWPAEPDSPFRMLDSASIRAMAASGLVEFGAHTVQHTILTRVPPARARAEIEQSIQTTAALSGRPCRLFAYPNGRASDYDAASLAVLQAAGIEAAVATTEGPNHSPIRPLELLRTGIGPELKDAAFQTLVHHAPTLLRGRHR